MRNYNNYIWKEFAEIVTQNTFCKQYLLRENIKLMDKRILRQYMNV